MTFDPTNRVELGVPRFARGEKLSTIERIVLLAMIGVIVVLDFLGFLLTPGASPLPSIVSIAATAAFALFLWSPLIAAITLALVFAVSYFAGSEVDMLTAIAVAAGLLTRLASTALIFSYLALFLVVSALVAVRDAGSGINVAVHLILAVVSGSIGFALRMAAARGRRLEQQLAERAEQEKQAVLAERRWIAGELHDNIAHHLTVVALHVQMLDDTSSSRASQEAIRVAASKAMTDLRFVIELADEGTRDAEVLSGDLATALEEARSEFQAAGHTVLVAGDPHDPRISRLAELVFARVVRESATNVLKYAGPGEIVMRLRFDGGIVELTVTSPLPDTPRQILSSSRTGLARMAERVIGASGEFSAGEFERQWQVLARLPIARELDESHS